MRCWAMLVALGLLWAGAGGAQPLALQLAAGDTAPADYARAENWICRPGPGAQGATDGTCAGDLDAVALTATGQRTSRPFVPAVATPPIDCFYVYPTASDDPTFYSDLHVDASEERTVHAEAARFSAECRLFVPAYHQVTKAALRWRQMQAAGQRASAPAAQRINDIPYRDVRDAWAAYLARDNGGRGVVLIGHSQGAVLLKLLIAREIDGRPAQRLLAGAYLAGNPDLGTASFRAVHPCRAIGETGCLVAWSSFPEGYAGARDFGGSREGAPVCVNPAAPGGGRAPLTSFLRRPTAAPASDPPFVAAIGLANAECVADGEGAVLRVRVEPGRYADLMRRLLDDYDRRPAWGLHPLDIDLVQGNMVHDIAAQSAAWIKRGQ